jgi:hypothetical protein
MKEWLKKHWKVLALAGAGVLGLYLLMQRRGGGGAASPADGGAGLPQTGPPPVGNQTPTPNYFSPSEAVASQYSQQLANNLTPASLISGKQASGKPWSLGALQQNLVTQYEQAIGALPPSLNASALLPPSPEQLASDYLAATGKQPQGWHYYPGQGEGTHEKATIGNWLSDAWSGVKKVAGAYASYESGGTISPGNATAPSAPAYPHFTPGIAGGQFPLGGQPVGGTSGQQPGAASYQRPYAGAEIGPWAPPGG